MNVTIIGDGGWGTALALILDRNKHNVKVWGPFEKNISSIHENFENKVFLPGIKLPKSIKWTSDVIDASSNANLFVFVVPSRFYRSTLDLFSPYISNEALVVSATKGFDDKTLSTMSVVAEEILKRSIIVLSGPSHAEEAAKGIPSAVVVASKNQNDAELIQSIFINKIFRVYTSNDVIGVELGGALKNIIAIAAGISDGLGFGDNTKAALMTRGLAEMVRLGKNLGANIDTFSGLSGIGDLMVTCMSRHSRNRAAGEKLGKGYSLNQITSNNSMVIEGIDNCKISLMIAQKNNISLPIIEKVSLVISNSITPKEAMMDLMNRQACSED